MVSKFLRFYAISTLKPINSRSMGDVDGPIVAKRVYEELFAGEEEFLNPSSVPYALDAALQELRKQNLQPSRWAPYVHFGI